MNENVAQRSPGEGPVLVVAIHGILTSQTDASWPDRLDAWLFHRQPRFKVLKKEYRAGPFPRWNCWVRDPRLARGLAAEVELFLAGGGGASRTPGISPPTWFVAHSNGAVIALQTARRLIGRGYWVGGVILTGAACAADVSKNGVWEWLHSNPPRLGAAIAYASAGDKVLAGDARSPAGDGRFARLRAWLWGRLIAPYGCLGRTGWLREGKPLSPRPGGPRLFTRWFDGGHSGYFEARQIHRTFELICNDIAAFTPPCEVDGPPTPDDPEAQ